MRALSRQSLNSVAIFCVILLLAFNLVSTFLFAQTAYNSDTWDVLVGSVGDVDLKQGTLTVLVRGGVHGTNGSPTAVWDWKHGDYVAMPDLRLQARPESTPIKVALAKDIKVFKVADSRLTSQSPSSIEPHAPVLIQLERGQYFPTKGSSPHGLVAARVVLLQACIEESCVKPKCKGGTDCKEKACDCKGSK